MKGNMDSDVSGLIISATNNRRTLQNEKDRSLFFIAAHSTFNS